MYDNLFCGFPGVVSVNVHWRINLTKMSVVYIRNVSKIFTVKNF